MTEVTNREAVTFHREAEWELIEAEIKRRLREPVPYSNSIISLYGTAGIGKSTFINRTFLPRLTKYSDSVTWAKVDFDKELVDARYDAPQNRGRLTLDLALGLIQNGRLEEPADLAQQEEQWKKALEAYDPDDQEMQAALKQAEAVLVDAFLGLADKLIDGSENPRVVIFVLDTAEEASRSLMGWIQEKLQKPTTDTGRALWVIAGRQPVECQLYYLYERFHWHELAPLEDKELRKLLPKERDRLVTAYQPYAHGIPAFALRVDKTVGDIGVVSAPELAEEKVVAKLVAAVEQLLNDKRYLGKLSDKLRATLYVLSPLRFFTLGIIAELLYTELKDEYPLAPIGVEAMNVVQQLAQTKLVGWSRERRGYVIEEPLRQVVANVEQHRRLERFARVHRWAAERYTTWAKNVPDKRLDYTIEALYHQAIILRVLEELSAEDAAKVLREALASAAKSFDGFDAKNTLRQQLQSDKDFAALLLGQLDEVLSALDEKSETVEDATASA